jgi:SpoVK/Ycf46/Vps4 family AAA+-type ATPase
MERFDGLAILTTNLQANLDEAVVRRLAVVVEFPLPGEADRLRLWDRHLAPPVPRAPDVDLAFLARAFRLSGGSIRSIALAAAYLAAEAGEAVGMSHLVRATEREYRKLGRLCGREEFGPYYHLVATVGRDDR